jgi:hypothetical protein
VYEIDTTPLPADRARGEDWCNCFHSRFPQHHPFSARHNGENKIRVECFPKDEPGRLDEIVAEIDAAIEYTNEQVK